MRPEDILLSAYAEGMSQLAKSGVIEVLRANAKVRAVEPGAVNYKELSVAELNRSLGYTQAIEHLLFFKEYFMQDREQYVPRQDYGSVDYLEKNKFITKDQADGLRKNFNIGKR